MRFGVRRMPTAPSGDAPNARTMAGREKNQLVESLRGRTTKLYEIVADTHLVAISQVCQSTSR